MILLFFLTRVLRDKVVAIWSSTWHPGHITVCVLYREKLLVLSTKQLPTAVFYFGRPPFFSLAVAGRGGFISSFDLTLLAKENLFRDWYNIQMAAAGRRERKKERRCNSIYRRVSSFYMHGWKLPADFVKVSETNRHETDGWRVQVHSCPIPSQLFKKKKREKRRKTKQMRCSWNCQSWTAQKHWSLMRTTCCQPVIFLVQQKKMKNIGHMWEENETKLWQLSTWVWERLELLLFPVMNLMVGLFLSANCQAVSYWPSLS